MAFEEKLEKAYDNPGYVRDRVRTWSLSRHSSTSSLQTSRPTSMSSLQHRIITQGGSVNKSPDGRHPTSRPVSSGSVFLPNPSPTKDYRYHPSSGGHRPPSTGRHRPHTSSSAAKTPPRSPGQSIQSSPMNNFTPTSMMNSIPVTPPKNQPAIAGSGVILSPGSNAAYMSAVVPSMPASPVPESPITPDHTHKQSDSALHSPSSTWGARNPTIKPDETYNADNSTPDRPRSSWGSRNPTIQPDETYNENISKSGPPPQSSWGARSPNIQPDQMYEEHDF